MVICKPPTPQHEHLRHARSTVADMDLFICPFTVLADTREQAPWSFQQIVFERRLWMVRRVVTTLLTGDYTIAGCEDRLVIERKSASDLVGSVTVGNARFRREHERMQTVVEAGGVARVIVEGSLSAICDELDQDTGRRVTSESIMGAVASWPMRYGVHWLFAGDRRRAELLAFHIMRKWWGQHHG